MITTQTLVHIPSDEKAEKENELAVIQSNFVQITDQQTHDFAVQNIKQADTFVKSAEAWFAKLENPAKQILETLKAEKIKIIGSAKAFIEQQRRQVLDWQLAQEERIKAEQEEKFKTLMPWEDPSAVLAPVPASQSGASTRYKAWEARVEDIDKLWEAAIKDPRYREYFVVDLKALNAKARSQQEAFNIPGCVAFREKTLVVKG
jgi:hypothetical protein